LILFRLDKEAMQYIIKQLAELEIAYNPKLVWIPPAEFLRRIGHTEFHRLREESVKSIEEGLKQGNKFPPLIHIANRHVEGRNRAAVAQKLGIKLVPVLVKSNEYYGCDWDSIINKVLEATQGIKRLYQPIEHPFFSDWEVTQQCSDRLNIILQYLGDVVGLRILDIGFFYGYFSHRLAQKGAVVVGLELSPKKVEIAKALSSCFGLPPWNPAFVHASYQEYLQRYDERFDVTLFLSQFHHNLLSEHTNILFLDMNESMAREVIPDWSCNLILRNTTFKDFKALGHSEHGRVLYVFHK